MTTTKTSKFTLTFATFREDSPIPLRTRSVDCILTNDNFEDAFKDLISRTHYAHNNEVVEEPGMNKLTMHELVSCGKNKRVNGIYHVLLNVSIYEGEGNEKL